MKGLMFNDPRSLPFRSDRKHFFALSCIHNQAKEDALSIMVYIVGIGNQSSNSKRERVSVALWLTSWTTTS